MGSEQSVTSAAGSLPPAAIIEPKGRAVLCLWAALPGIVLAPFVFWQSLVWGIVFCVLWALFDFCVWARACSFVACLTAHTLCVQCGLTFCSARTLPRRGVTSVLRITTPLLRLAGASMLIVFSPGLWVLLPALPREQAAALERELARSGRQEGGA